MEWAQVVLTTSVIAGNLAIIIALSHHYDKKSARVLRAIQDDIKTFGIRLSRQNEDIRKTLTPHYNETLDKCQELKKILFSMEKRK